MLKCKTNTRTNFGHIGHLKSKNSKKKWLLVDKNSDLEMTTNLNHPVKTNICG